MPERVLPAARYAGLACLVSIAGVVFALYLQHGRDMQPCAWCVFQRLLYLVLAVFAALAWALRSKPPAARTAAVFGMLTGLGGLAAAIWQHVVATGDLSCNLTLADKAVVALRLDSLLPSVFQATALCSEANMPMLGVPFALWSAAFFLFLTGLLALTVFSKGAGR